MINTDADCLERRVCPECKRKMFYYFERKDQPFCKSCKIYYTSLGGHFVRNTAAGSQEFKLL